MIRNILIIISYILIAVLGCLFIYNLFDNRYNIKDINFKKYKKLMIVAHPDDDSLWGGAHLMNDSYVVVCITCSKKNKTRYNEFISAMDYSGNYPIALGYPDKTFGVRNDWSSCKKNIYKDLTEIIKSNDWDLIVTHNSKGEYGHKHHIMTNEIVTDIYNQLNTNSSLYYFGTYYSKKSIVKAKKLPEELDSESLEKKNGLIDIYKSQDFIKESFNHMIKYESWNKYEKIK